MCGGRAVHLATKTRNSAARKRNVDVFDDIDDDVRFEAIFRSSVEFQAVPEVFGTFTTRNNTVGLMMSVCLSVFFTMCTVLCVFVCVCPYSCVGVGGRPHNSSVFVQTKNNVRRITPPLLATLLERGVIHQSIGKEEG